MKKLDDLPKGKPHTYDDVMKALHVLHKGVLKQMELYGGKNSKLFIPHVVEGSLLKTVTNASLAEDCDEASRLMDLAQERGEELAAHLKGIDDKKALSLLGQILKYTGAAISTANKPSK